ncbi:MAG: hypothetical protein V2J11_02520 [Desulfofustis sp.]|jgi:hypothetical protein|nr:hypothetical protein [Desulfofustis sp.]
MQQATPLLDDQNRWSALLRDETWCTNYLFLFRWPQEFICPACGRSGGRPSPAIRVTCRYCGKTTSITTGTLLHGTKKPLSLWLQTLWWLSALPQQLTGKTLQRQLGLKSYQTAWSWLKTLRRAMRDADRQRCSGTIEVDCGFISFDSGETQGRTLLAVVEVEPKNRMAGRLHLAHCAMPTPQLLVAFIENTTEPGSTLLAPDRPPFILSSRPNRLYLVETGCTSQERAREAIDRCYARFRQQQGPKCSPARLQEHLDEFCFRHNSALSANRRLIFDRLVEAVLLTDDDFRQQAHAEPLPAGGLP